MLTFKTYCLGPLLQKRVKKSNNANAIGWIESDKVQFYNYNEYYQHIKNLALALQLNDMKVGTKVAILSATCIEWHLVDMAVMCSRGVVVPIYPSYTAEEIHYLLEHSECEILILEDNYQLEKIIEIQDHLKLLKKIITLKACNEELKNKVSHIEIKTYKQFIREGVEHPSPHLFEDLSTSQKESDIATIIYTSGTTGEPKGAVITQKAFCKMLENVHHFFHGHLSYRDRTLTWLPLSHVFGRTDSMLPLIFGWEVVYAESLEKLVNNISTSTPTIMCAVPRIFEKIYNKILEQVHSYDPVKKKLFEWANQVSNVYFEKLEKDMSPSTIELVQRNIAYNLVFKKIYNRFGGKLRFFVSGGAPLSIDIFKFFRNANLTILEGYGLTETIAPCVANPISKQKVGSVGIPIGDVEIKFAEDNEILIKSEAMFLEYYKNPQATAESLIEGWFYSGDIGHFDNEGYLFITDRKKDIIITSGGKNIAPQKIENMMKVQKYITHFLAVGDRQKFLTGIVGIEKDSFLDKLEEFGLNKNCSIEEMGKNPQVIKLVQENIDEVNKELASYESVKKFIIAPREFTVESGDLTPSLKLKKKKIIKEFANAIDSMYK